jgi:hypothetical protein
LSLVTAFPIGLWIYQRISPSDNDQLFELSGEFGGQLWIDEDSFVDCICRLAGVLFLGVQCMKNTKHAQNSGLCAVSRKCAPVLGIQSAASAPVEPASTSALPSTLPTDSAQATVLRMLRVLSLEFDHRLLPENGLLWLSFWGCGLTTMESAVNCVRHSKTGDLPSKIGSYAAAVRAPPSDWHFQFLIGSEELSMADTVYGAECREPVLVPQLS